MLKWDYVLQMLDHIGDTSTLDLINVLFHAEEKLNRFHKIDRELIEN